jgi:hypothetical protein
MDRFSIFAAGKFEQNIRDVDRQNFPGQPGEDVERFCALAMAAARASEASSDNV